MGFKRQTLDPSRYSIDSVVQMGVLDLHKQSKLLR